MSFSIDFNRNGNITVIDPAGFITNSEYTHLFIKPVFVEGERADSVVRTVVTEHWYMGDVLHRDKGPAIIGSYYEMWYQHGIIHREDGPAITRDRGRTQIYMLDGARVDAVDLMHKRNKEVYRTIILDGVEYHLVPVKR